MGVTLHIIMNRITFLLCALANQVTSQTNDIFPAKILAQQKTISENSDLYVICSTFGFKSKITVYVYLCKDDHWIIKKTQKPDQYDTSFMIDKVGIHHSGNYSCVHSIRNDSLPKVVRRGHNVIQILVISNFLPADISVAGPSTVREGDDAAFRCTVSDNLQTLGECKLIHSYLRRDEAILQVQAFNVTQMEATFSIKGVVMRDAGHYSCVVLPSKCIQEHEKTLYGNNAVLLEVKVSLHFRLIASCGVAVLFLMLLLGLSLWWINKQGCSALCDSCAASHQSDADMVEEQPVQSEEEDLEEQDGNSFSMEEEEEYQNVAVDGDFTYSDDYVYSVADDPPVGPDPSCVYAKSVRQKKRYNQGSVDCNFTHA